MPTNDLGRQMKIYRASKDLTQAALGKKIGAGHAHISRIESGVVNPTKKQRAKLAKLGIMEAR